MPPKRQKIKMVETPGEAGAAWACADRLRKARSGSADVPTGRFGPPGNLVELGADGAYPASTGQASRAGSQMEIFTAEGFAALLQVIMIDLVLAGDNAIVIGLAAAGLPADLRRKAILIGIIAATVMRIGFALVTVQLLAIVGLLLMGGILLLWVCWKMWRELRAGHAEEQQQSVEALADADLNADGTVSKGAPRKTLRQAVIQIVVADVSMSLDNVLAVAGAAREHPSILVFGLVLSIALMGLAASFIARLLTKHRWIAYIGLAIILYVALDMIWRGWEEVGPAIQAAGLLG
jgi:YjbE family integral membrane protein